MSNASHLSGNPENFEDTSTKEDSVKLGLLIPALALSLFASTVHAEEQQRTKSLHEQFTGQGYGMAGCGLGSIVFGQEPGMVQVVAATTNNWIVPQTFAISTGTSNCGASGKMQRASQFIEINKVALDNDLARGTGETITSLGQVMGCTNSDFATNLRSSYSLGTSQEQLTMAANNACKI